MRLASSGVRSSRLGLSCVSDIGDMMTGGSRTGMRAERLSMDAGKGIRVRTEGSSRQCGSKGRLPGPVGEKWGRGIGQWRAARPLTREKKVVVRCWAERLVCPRGEMPGCRIPMQTRDKVLEAKEKAEQLGEWGQVVWGNGTLGIDGWKTDGKQS